MERLAGFLVALAKDCNVLDSRPAIICDDVSDITFSSIKMQGNKDADAMIRLQNSADILIYNSYVLGSYNKLVGSVDSKSVRVIGLAD